MLRLVDLANRSDFAVGPLRVSPARRLLEGPGGNTTLEPIVMKVLLLLLDARGAVVTRDEIFANAWGGVFVGDDSLNRAIARTRKTLAGVAPGSFEIETIPRTGYRLTGDISDSESPGSTLPQEPSMGLPRRAVLGAAAGAALAGIGGIALWSVRSSDERRFNDLVDRGRAALEYGDGSANAAGYLRQAVDIRSSDAKTQGMLAFALMAHTDNVNGSGASDRVEEAQRAADISLRLDPSEPNARLARIELQRATLDIASTEDRLRQVLTAAPNNIFAMRLLWNLLQSAGRSHEGLALAQRAIAVRPLAAGNNFPLAQLLWIVGRTAEADRVIDRAMQFWPTHRYVRFARFTIFAFTGRPRAALAMLDNDATRPQSFTPASLALWRTSLAALDVPSAENVSNARAANLDSVKRDPKLASQAVLTLSALGQVDSAFEIANDLLVFQPPGSSPSPAGVRPKASSVAWRFIPWLFTPPAAPLRADPRFAALTDGIGLTAYWAARRIKPDYQLG